MNTSLRRPWAVAIGAVAAVGLAGGASAHDGKHAKHDDTISAGKLAKDAKKYYGKTVTVTAEVEDVIDNHTFTLDEDALFAGADVLVLVRTPLSTMPVHDQKVKVTGVVRPYVVAELDRDLDFFDEGKLINTETKVDYKTRPVLVATHVMLADGRDLLGASAVGRTDDSDTPTPSTSTSMAAPDVLISATKLVRDPKDYYGRTISVRSDVEKVLSANAFTLDEDAVFKGPDVLVLVPRGVASGLRENEKVTVTGTVRRWVVAELDRDLDFFDDGKIVNTETKVDWDTRPVIVATSVRTADGRDLMATPR
jgi:hypothetical protein